MGFEVLVLGVISGLRPATSHAAVVALLRTHTAVRSLLAFAVAGMVISVAFGLLVVFAFKGVGSAVGRSTFASLFDLVAGVAALGFAAGVRRGGLPRRRERERERPRGRATTALAVRLQRPSMATAAAAGVATHLPGLIYLAVLNSIAAEQPNLAEATMQIAVYNLLWFAIPLTALTFAVRSPATAREYLNRATVYARRNQDRVLVALFGTLGVYLSAKGIADLI
jgi:hypothetical protein